MAAIAALMLGLSLLVIVAAYGAILATTERSARELAWTILPALLLVALLAVSTQAIDAGSR